MRAPSAEDLRAMLAEKAVFHSPVVHTPQEGRDKVFAYLHAADSVFGGSGFRYVREIVDGDQAMLEFTAEIDGIHINGVDIIRWNADGLIGDFKVMVRPLKAIDKLRELMGAELERAQKSA
ncbi:MAG: nuclear transport factor 2 family protein [Sphingomonadales bacterium]|nr:nuclear transport factor 2 family protein [Sphingomonadales bacterium]